LAWQVEIELGTRNTLFNRPGTRYSAPLVWRLYEAGDGWEVGGELANGS